jgi:hypothetical protein
MAERKEGNRAVVGTLEDATPFAPSNRIRPDGRISKSKVGGV